MFGPPGSRTRDFSVLPRVRTERFCITLASASEQRTSVDGMPLLIRLTMSVSAARNFTSSATSHVRPGGRLDGDGDMNTMGRWERASNAVSQVFGVRVSSRSTACTGAEPPCIRCMMAP